MFKVIIAGGRDFGDYDLLSLKLDKILSNINGGIEIISGNAKGADYLGERYAIEHNYKIKNFPANWNLYGNSAGFIRNVEMAKYADACVCFWNRKSSGTKHMIKLAKENNLKLRIIYY